MLKRQLGRKLRELREEAKLTVVEAAERLEFSPSKLSRMENGTQTVTVHEVRSMMDLYDIYDEDLLDMARKAKEKGWWKSYGLDNRGYIPLEAGASMVRAYQLTYMPGLMQTSEYARQVFAHGVVPRTPEWIDNAVAIRMFRQERLVNGDGLELATIVDETVLRRPIGGDDVMREQFDHLLELAVLPNVTLQVLPISPRPHPGMAGSFNILSFPSEDDQDVAYVEHPGGSFQIEKPADVNACRLVFDHLRSLALSPDDSARFVEQARR
jgi:transcriptional regulator with XRE-family HTH domain